MTGEFLNEKVAILCLSITKIQINWLKIGQSSTRRCHFKEVVKDLR